MNELAGSTHAWAGGARSRPALARCAAAAALAALIGAAAATAGSVPAAAANGDPAAVDSIVAFVGVNVIPMDSERVLGDHTVVIRGDRIVEVGPADRVPVPDGARTIDGRGHYLIPGLAEMHGHIPAATEPEAFTEAVLFLFLAGNVTTVRGMLGHPNQLELRDRVARGELLGPTLYLAGPSFSGVTIQSAEQARRRVAEQIEAGWDLLKVHPGLTRDQYDAMAETARRGGIRFGGHVPADVGFLHAIEMGQETFDHLDGMVQYAMTQDGRLDPDRVVDIVRRTREAGAWVVPTLALWEVLIGALDLDTLRAYPELRYMPDGLVRTWVRRHEERLANPQLDRDRARRMARARIDLLRALHDGGVRILMGTDAPQQFSVPGFSLRHELERMLAAGMSPYQVLRTGTVAVGEYFADRDRFGMIAAGHRADLILLEANPLRDLGNLDRRAGVMASGRWLPESEIRDRLERIAAGA